MTYRIEYAGFSMQGPRRRSNEDNLFFAGNCLPAVHGDLEVAPAGFADADGQWLAVFDGMGGEAKGEMASYLCAEALHSAAAAGRDRQEMQAVAERMNRAVCEYAAGSRVQGMGSTAACILFAKEGIRGFNVGDSRCYRMSDGCLERLSTDHAVRIRAEGQKLLTQHIGIDERDFRIQAQNFARAYRPGDLYLLCTDGVTDQIMDRKLRQILAEPTDLAVKVDQLRAHLLRKALPDNATALLAQVRIGSLI